MSTILTLIAPSTSTSTTATFNKSPPRSHFFSTTHLLRNTNPNPSYPRLSLKRISPNPRVRMALGAGLALLVVAEGYAWVKFWPRIRETWRGDGEGEA